MLKKKLKKEERKERKKEKKKEEKGVKEHWRLKEVCQYITTQMFIKYTIF